MFVGAAQVEAERAKALNAQSALLAMPVATHTPLSGHINSCWIDARDAKRPVQARMLQCAKMRRGEYDAGVLSAIKEFGGSEHYFPSINIKCIAAAAYILDIYLSDDRPWGLDPTPIPDLPPDLLIQVVQRVQQEILLSDGVPSDDDISAMDERATKEVLAALKKDADERARKMERKIDDTLKEGGWVHALAEVINDLVTYPAAILKGPVLRMRPNFEWVQDETGGYAPVVHPGLCLDWDRVSPFDFYPQRNIKHPDDGYVFERLRLNRRKITEMKGVPGYNDAEIDAVLDESQAGGSLRSGWIWDGEAEANEAEERDTLEGTADGLIDGLEFWGSVPGQWLLDWGMDAKKIADPRKEYPITAILVGKHVIRAAINPHPLGQKIYHVESWSKIPGSFWGQGIPEQVVALVSLLNVAVRALANNIAIASGPQVGIDVAVAPAGMEYDQVIPWRVWKLNSAEQAGMGGSDNGRLPIVFFQPQMQAEVLLGVINSFIRFIDEYTGIPGYTHGVAQSGGGDTASGQAMLMNAAGRIIKNITAKIDSNLVASSVRRVWEYLMQYHADHSIKGDSKIVTHGASAVAVKEQQLIRMQELLDRTRNDVDLSIMGAEARGELLKAVFKAHPIPGVEKIIPIIEKNLEMQEQQQAAMQAIAGQRKTGNLDQPQGQALDAAGNPAGGTDVTLFNPERQGAVA